jgi:hypothetical protein
MIDSGEPWWKKPHSPNCSGCRPVLLDVETGETMSHKHPAMIAVNAEYDKTTDRERQAWHAFTVQNSRDPEVMVIIADLQARFQAAMKSVEETEDECSSQ